MVNAIIASYEYIIDITKLWLVLWGLMNFTPIRNKQFFKIMGIIHIFIIMGLGYIYIINKNTGAILETFLVIIIVCFMFSGKFFHKLAISLLSYTLILFLDGCVYGICSLLGNMSGYDFLKNNIGVYFENIINIVTIVILIYLKLKTKSLLHIKISKRIYLLLFSGALTGCIILATIITKPYEAKPQGTQKIIIIVTIIAVIIYNAACVMIIIILESRDNYKALSLINQNVIESQQQYYTLVNEKQQEMRSIRHEINHHLSCLNGLFKANKLSELEQYLTQLVDSSYTTVVLFDTGNDIVNAILNDAQSKYKKDNIIIRLEGVFPYNLQISQIDLCVIFANMVSNAVEAIQRMERDINQISYIDIKIKCFKDDLFIDVKNPVNKNIKLNIKKLNTSKKNKEIHGFGIKNIIQRVEKYYGKVKFIYENDEFFVKIEMKIAP